MLAFHLEMWLSIPFLYLILHGYTYMALLGMVGMVPRRRLTSAQDPG